ncbi:uncharacterized protein BDCG_09148 [Blastomyces dermatitidis ER-3]|uniref:Uncharacterized protein n=2 Tax=Blastomyces TaxID=229219 RepID=A0A179V226_BLAGS|nr:uncharacterized protein BDBG_09417 [Blastomyces gilchristii SLH14081]XP_045273539.1 uncharacterized protein BDCG_09148 [Blastomyces dermatitidis ER-3]EEQ85879.2 hypothetical protein BDCG_09148 [Blastomyces dermatitidis ER-3]OAT14366.1 hypothetical protein BDBG_09417 [Blastomyces gilchristii SLH14081]
MVSKLAVGLYLSRGQEFASRPEFLFLQSNTRKRPVFFGPEDPDPERPSAEHRLDAQYQDFYFAKVLLGAAEIPEPSLKSERDQTPTGAGMSPVGQSDTAGTLTNAGIHVLVRGCTHQVSGTSNTPTLDLCIK